jgi:hypothetical protein
MNCVYYIWCFLFAFSTIAGDGPGSYDIGFSNDNVFGNLDIDGADFWNADDEEGEDKEVENVDTAPPANGQQSAPALQPVYNNSLPEVMPTDCSPSQKPSWVFYRVLKDLKLILSKLESLLQSEGMTNVQKNNIHLIYQQYWQQFRLMEVVHKEVVQKERSVAHGNYNSGINNLQDQQPLTLSKSPEGLLPPNHAPFHVNNAFTNQQFCSDSTFPKNNAQKRKTAEELSRVKKFRKIDSTFADVVENFDEGLKTGRIELLPKVGKGTGIKWFNEKLENDQVFVTRHGDNPLPVIMIALDSGENDKKGAENCRRNCNTSIIRKYHHLINVPPDEILYGTIDQGKYLILAPREEEGKIKVFRQGSNKRTRQ